MTKMISAPLLFQDKEYQTIISVCPIGNEVRLSVHILNDRLARKLASRNVFVLSPDGKIRPYYAQGQMQMSSEFQLLVQQMVHSYINTQSITSGDRTAATS